MARTQRLLHEALIALLLERGWDAVTVHDVCERADVGRSTFYVHFADKEELLLSGFDVFEAALQQQVASSSNEPFAFLNGLIAHVRDHQRIYRALVGKRSGQRAAKRLAQLVSEMMKREVERSRAPRANREAVVAYLTGACMELLIRWLDAEVRLTPHELELVLHRLSVAVLGELPDLDAAKRA